MKKYIFSGRSDDTFGEYETSKDDYDNCASGEPIKFELKDANGFGFFVAGQYSPNGSGCWSIAVEPIDEDKYPDWEIKFVSPSDHNPCPYTMLLSIEAPDDAILTCLSRDPDNSD